MLPSISPALSATFQQWQTRLHQELWRQVMPFWLNHSLDREEGGYFNNLDRDGRVYDTQKHVWLQARQVWMTAKFHNQGFDLSGNRRESLVDNSPAQHPATPDTWLAVAQWGLTFLRRYAHRSDHRVYFCLTRHGDPVYLQRKIFSECFYIMALSEVCRATTDPVLLGELWAETQAVFRAVWIWSEDLSLLGHPCWSGSVAVSQLAIPMILLNVLEELSETFSQFVCIRLEIEESKVIEEGWKVKASDCVEKILRHVRSDLNLVLETVGVAGELMDGPEGRLVNPGHAIEAGWFLLAYAERNKHENLMKTAIQMIEWSLNIGWDPDYGGLFYFLDREGYSPIQLEWNLKLWWPHCEAMIATLWAGAVTKDMAWLARFETIADYTFSHFPDPDYGEWFGYLDREGRVSQRFKGGPYKGCFHVPRALWLSHTLLTRLLCSFPQSEDETRS
ncbi:MAG: AGE family epimerase/isomerase [Cyanobacteriota bacterium]|nr:AGE family epimerase/isomerase [Cyanobacteriota bacterium]